MAKPAAPISSASSPARPARCASPWSSGRSAAGTSSRPVLLQLDDARGADQQKFRASGRCAP